jgi:hypothetical protein
VGLPPYRNAAVFCTRALRHHHWAISSIHKARHQDQHRGARCFHREEVVTAPRLNAVNHARRRGAPRSSCSTKPPICSLAASAGRSARHRRTVGLGSPTADIFRCLRPGRTDCQKKSLQEFNSRSRRPPQLAARLFIGLRSAFRLAQENLQSKSSTFRLVRCRTKWSFLNGRPALNGPSLSPSPRRSP